MAAVLEWRHAVSFDNATAIADCTIHVLSQSHCPWSFVLRHLLRPFVTDWSLPPILSNKLRV